MLFDKSVTAVTVEFQLLHLFREREVLGSRAALSSGEEEKRELNFLSP